LPELTERRIAPRETGLMSHPRRPEASQHRERDPQTQPVGGDLAPCMPPYARRAWSRGRPAV